MAQSKAILLIFGTIIAFASSEAHYGYGNYGYPSYIYNQVQPQYYSYAQSYPSYGVPNVQYGGVVPSPTYQQQQQQLSQDGVQYGPVHRYQPVVTSVRQVFYEPQPASFEPVQPSVSVVADSKTEAVESVPATRRVVPPLRAIFPDFSRAGLRSNGDIGFLRPDQVQPLPEKFLSPNIISF